MLLINDVAALVLLRHVPTIAVALMVILLLSLSVTVTAALCKSRHHLVLLFTVADT